MVTCYTGRRGWRGEIVGELLLSRQQEAGEWDAEQHIDYGDKSREISMKEGESISLVFSTSDQPNGPA